MKRMTQQLALQSKSSKKGFYSEQNEQPSDLTDNCPLCNEGCMHILISSALFNKHTSSQNFYYTKQLQDIIDQAPSIAVIKHKQNIALDENQQFLRRFYKQEQYQNKNKAISQYYKFHHDYPKLHQLGIDRILQKYYDRKKEHDYKKIKRILKQEEDISITTQKSSTIVSVDEEEKKSRYSDILGDLDNQDDINDNQSQVLKKICQKIGKAYDKRAMSPFMTKKKSIFYQGNVPEETQSKKFRQYLKKQEAKAKKQNDSIKNSAQNSLNQKQKTSKKYSTSGTSIVASVGSRKLKSTIKNALFYDGKPYVSGSSINSNNMYHRLIPPYQNPQQIQKFGNENLYGTMNQNDELKSNMITHNAFKRNKQPNLNMYGPRQDAKNQSTKITVRKSQSRSNINSKQKASQKTTEDIYKNAAQQLRNGKRSTSFNSLINKQQSQRNSFSNLLMKQKSQFSSSKYLKQKNIIANNQYNMSNFNTKTSRTKSTINLLRYQPHQFYEQQDHQQQQPRKIRLTSTSLKNLKVKSSSTTKISKDNKIDNFNTITKPQKPANLFTDTQMQNQNLGSKVSKSKQIYRSSKQKQARNTYTNHDGRRKSESKNIIQEAETANTRSKINIDNILQRKLFLQPTKGVVINKLLI